MIITIPSKLLISRKSLQIWDMIDNHKYMTEHIWISSFSIYCGINTMSLQQRDFRFMINNMMFQLDSESIFEMKEEFPDFVIGSSIRGEGKLNCPVLYNITKLQNIPSKNPFEIYKSSMAEIMKQNSKLSKKLKGSLKFILFYIERYKKIKFLEEEGTKAVGKIKHIIDSDSKNVYFSKYDKKYIFSDEMTHFNQEILSKRIQYEESDKEEDLIEDEQLGKKGFALYGKGFMDKPKLSKDEQQFEEKLRRQIQDEKFQKARRLHEKNKKIEMAKLKLKERNKYKKI